MPIKFNRSDLEVFMSLFKARNDIYARWWEKDGRSGYSPAYQFDWNEFMAFKAKGGKMQDFQNKKLIPLTESVVYKHLCGQSSIGIYPLLQDNTSYFISADFDKENWQTESTALIQACTNHGIPAYLERSRSGNGAHVWIFFEKAYPATKSRKIMFELIKKALNFSEFEKEISFDRLFPNQDYHNQKGFGNLIALPLQGEAVSKGNSCFIDPITFATIDDQWGYLRNIKRISAEKLDSVYGEITNTSINETKPLNTGELIITVRNQIFLKKAEIRNDLAAFLKENLNILNQEYLIKKKLGKSTYKTEKYFKLIEEDTENIIIPRGFLSDLENFCNENDIKYQVVDKRKTLKEICFKSKIKLHDYQEEVLRKFENKDSGVLVAPPGSGKTIMGLELISRKKQPALILVHRKQLFDQWVERIQSFLGINKKDIGRLCGSKKKFGKNITVAMLQSLVRFEDKDFSEIDEKFSTIIVDECHHVPAKTFRATISKLNPYYLYGLTATPKRKHNDENLIFMHIGNIIANIDSSSYNKNNLIKLSHVIVRETEFEVPFENTTDDFKLLTKILIFDTRRNEMIVEDIRKQANIGSKILVLTERREHVDILNLYLKKDYETIAITGEDSIGGRKSKLDQIKAGHFQILISTGQFFGEGMDIDHLNCLFLVYPFSFEGKLIQYIGRIQRSSKSQMIFDYRDKKVSYFENLFKQRNKYYNKLEKTHGVSRDEKQVSLF